MELIKPVQIRNSSILHLLHHQESTNLNRKCIQAQIPNVRNLTQNLHLENSLPTMSDIINSAKKQNLDLQLQTLGPFFRITARSLEAQTELGRVEGLIRYWFEGKNLHLDSIKLKRETIGIENSLPTMSDIINSAKKQNLDLQLQTLGPFFRITARSLEAQTELGRAEGVIRYWFEGKILHLDSIKLKRETIGIEKSIFGIGLFIGAVAIRHGYENSCRRAELLAINDTDLYHTKLVRFYTRLGFNAVYEVTGSSVKDISDMLMWGGVGTRMDADLEQLMIKWCSRFKPKKL